MTDAFVPVQGSPADDAEGMLISAEAAIKIHRALHSGQAVQGPLGDLLGAGESRELEDTSFGTSRVWFLDPSRDAEGQRVSDCLVDFSIMKKSSANKKQQASLEGRCITSIHPGGTKAKKNWKTQGEMCSHDVDSAVSLTRRAGGEITIEENSELIYDTSQVPQPVGDYVKW